MLFMTISGSIVIVVTLGLIWHKTKRLSQLVALISGGVGSFYTFLLLAYVFLAQYGFVQADY